MQKIVREMKDNSSSALRGFLKGSVLHTQMLVILDKLDVELGKITGITNDPVEQASIIAKQRNDLRAKDTTINDLIERMDRQKVAMETKHAQEREVIEAGRAQEREEIEVKHAREKAELEEQIERLNNLVAQKERPRSNSYFFSGW
jgi:small-conductance mechanosensitive channel